MVNKLMIDKALIFFAFSVMFLVLSLAFSSAQSSGLIAAYNFDETSGIILNDLSGNNYNGSLVNNPLWVIGKNNNGLQFNALDDGNENNDPKVNIGTNLNVALPFTMSAWVNPVNYNDWRAIFSKRDSYSSSNMRVDIGLSSGSGQVYVTSAPAFLQFSYVPPTNIWTHVSVVAESTGTKLYVNGNLQQTIGAIALGTDTIANVAIGGTGEVNGDNDPFNGMIDDLRLYNRALTQAEIQTDMNTPVSGGPDTTSPLLSNGAPSGILAAGTTQTILSLTTNEAATCRYSTTAGVAYSSMANTFSTTGTTSHSQLITGLQNGQTYNYYVRCIDVSSNANTNDFLISFSVSVPDTQAPNVLINYPVNGAIVSGIFTINATASDNVVVTQVEFFVDNTSVGIDTTSPYSVSWNSASVVNGTHTIQARATDSSSNIGVDSVSIDVQNAVVTSPLGLIASYGFNENSGTILNDLSGNVNNGAITAAAWTTTGKYGSALQFDSASDVVLIPDSNSLDLTNGMTLEAWVYPTAVGTGWSAIIQKEVDAYALHAGSTSVLSPAIVGTFGGAVGYIISPSAIPVNQWSYLTGTYDGTTLRLYINGVQVTSAARTGLLEVNTNPVRIGSNTYTGENFLGLIDEVRIYNRSLSQAEIQSDMNTPVGGQPTQDTTPPVLNNGTPSGVLAAGTTQTTLSLNTNEAATCRYSTTTGISYGSMTNTFTTTGATSHSTLVIGLANGQSYNYYVRCIDVTGNANTNDFVISFSVSNVVVNATFVNEWIIQQGLTYPTAVEFLPDGRILISELDGTIYMAQPGATQVNSTPVVQISGVYVTSDAGLLDIKVDPNFSSNGYVYAFYVTTSGGVRDRLSRFTMVGNTASPSSEVILWQGDADSSPYHHGSGIAFGADGKIYFTTGDHFNAATSQDLTKDTGKLMRINPDGTIPIDNPFYDGAGPNKDAIWVYGLRNPFRLSYDSVTGNLYEGDVGGNSHDTAYEEVNIMIRGANYGWPNCEGPCGIAGITSPLYSYPHNNRDASITGGVIYRGTQFPAEYQGNYIFGDYAQNWIRRLTLNQSGTGFVAINYFFPNNSVLDSPSVGDPVSFELGPDGALYYIDIDFAEPEGLFNAGGLKRIRYVSNNFPPNVVASANPTSGPLPLQVSFSSVGTSDPENNPLNYSWNFGDGQTSTEANPNHTYQNAGQYTVILTVSDGTNNAVSTPILIKAGIPPSLSIDSPTAGAFFRAGDIINYSGSAVDLEDGVLPASAYEWTIYFHHDSHIHPVVTQVNVTSGNLIIPLTGHDYSGNTRYEIILKVTDSSGLQNSTSVYIYPDKVNLTLTTVPSGLSVKIEGITTATPLVKDTLIGFQHSLEAPNQFSGGNDYVFNNWSDGGAQTHNIIVPSVNQDYTAFFGLPPDTIVPVLSNGTPSGVLPSGTTQTALSLISDESAICRYSTTLGTAYSAMINTFSTTGATSHSQLITGLSNGQSYNYYVRCIDGSSNVNTNDFLISFSIENPDITAPTVLITSPNDGATINGIVNITANASDNVAVTQVQFFVDNVSVGIDTTSPYSVNWDSKTVVNGTHTIQARARDAELNIGTHSVSVNVQNSLLPAGLRLYYKFDEVSGATAFDSSGNGLNGAFAGGTANWTTGKVGGALNFDGVNDEIILNNFDPASNGTIAFWVRPTTLSPTRQRILGGDTSFEVQLRSNGKIECDTFFNGQSTGTTAVLALNTWKFVTCRYSVSGTQVTRHSFINGTLDRTDINSATDPGVDTLRIGRTTGTTNWFKGQVDELMIFDRALTNQEILILYNRAITPDTTAPTVPTNLSATPVSFTQINLAWTASVDAESGVSNYLVYRNDSLVGQPTTNLYSDTGLSPGVTYNYKVAAKNGIGLISANTSVVQATTLSDTISPVLSNGTPSGILSSGTTQTTLSLTTNEIATCRYSIIAGTDYSSMTNTFSTTGAISHSQLITGLVNGQTYNYYVRCIDVSSNANTNDFLISFSVSNPDTIAPTVLVNYPANGAIVSGIFTINANASDNVAVTQVQFFVDNVSVGIDTTSPYSISWNSNSVVNGTHLIEVRATDSSSNIGVDSVIVDVQNAPPSALPGLVAAYGFNENIGTTTDDSSGNSNTGTITGAVWTTGKYGGALNFDTGTDVVLVGDSNSLDLTNGMTLEAWVYPTVSKAGWAAIIQKDIDAYFLHAGGGGTLYPAFGALFPGQPYNIIYSSSALPLNQWSHLAGTYSGSQFKLYINGVEVSSGLASGNLEVNTNLLRIGSNTYTGENFLGLIDEVKIYNRALNQSEIQQDMNITI